MVSPLGIHNYEIELKGSKIKFLIFRWIQEENEEKSFLGVFANIVWRLKASDTKLHYLILGELKYPQPAADNVVRMKIPAPKKSSSKLQLYPDSYYEDLLKSYFRLNFDLEYHYKKWSESHQHFASNVSEKYHNIRQLDIDPIEVHISLTLYQN